jgi:predicted transcriptional regulator
VDDLSSKFLAAFNDIEDWVRHELGARDEEEFARLLGRMVDQDSQINRFAAELKRMARLRNLIAHNHSRDKPLAVPTLLSVERVEAIAKQLRSPPLLLSLSAKPVEQCRPSDPLGCCVKKMYEGLFSQLPIYDGDHYCGLLTSETIARWLAAFFVGDGNGIVDEQTVAEVIRHQEDSENVEFMARSTTVIHALAAFDRFLHRGKRLDAILLTNSGRQTEALLGIVTIHDIPKLNKAISG